jgi:hypothetical protein
VQGIEHVVGCLARQVFRQGAIDDLFSAGTKDIDFNEGISR